MTHTTDPPGTSRNGMFHLTPAQQQDFEDQQFLDYYIHLPDMRDANDRPAFQRLFQQPWLRHVKDIYDRRPDLIQGTLATWANTQRSLGLWWPDLHKAIRETAAQEILTLPHVPDQLMPPLPAEAYLEETLGAHAAPWLDAYKHYSQQWATRAAEAFHEAVGLWMLSTVAARRVCILKDARIFPNLFIALVARSTLYTKSTAAKLGVDGLLQAQCGALLYDAEATPQAFLQDMGGHVNPHYPVMTDEQQLAYRQRLAFASQCGWYKPEWGGMLEQMTRRDSPMTAFHDLLRRLDDNAEVYRNRTVTRGHEEIHFPYLAFLANATPADLTQFLKPGSRWWNDGFWPRFAMVIPRMDEEPSDAERPNGLHVMPASLVACLHDWHLRLGVPLADIEQMQDANGRPLNQYRRVMGDFPCTILGITAEADHAYNAYSRALIHMIQDNKIPEYLASCYGRYAEKALRVALLLASIDESPQITLEHWAYAQRVVERWRGMLHQLLVVAEQSQPKSRELALEEKIVEMLTRSGALTLRSMMRHTHNTTSKEMMQAIKGLLETGVIEEVKDGRRTLYRLSELGSDEGYENATETAEEVAYE